MHLQVFQRLRIIILLFNLALVNGLMMTTPLPFRAKTQRRKIIRPHFMSETNEVPPEPKVEYGVSYIGGDPCGSKYNNDPFDARVQKPGMPDNMKARIRALADQKRKDAQEKAEQES
mmetsp:Transcript_26377/g.39964  ORF Transcript_26377/g.39964 Transcript_26377/m.39964 type:complete len:117 (-) Transcript_26377:287-637(-)